ncbi:MAG: response regulator [Bauldia sp.]|nr:response regulator [Bauldia sp.]
MIPQNARILIVEDDALVAMEMEARVKAFGCAVMGPAPTIASADRLLDGARPDAALLDVDIRGARITPIAARLRDLGVPYALVTGYARLAFAEPELQVAKLSKPISPAELTRTLRRLLTPASAPA